MIPDLMIYIATIYRPKYNELIINISHFHPPKWRFPITENFSQNRSTEPTSLKHRLPDIPGYPSHTAPPILSRLAPVTEARTLFSSRQRNTPINAITNASL
jgi:hypothetical protein